MTVTVHTAFITSSFNCKIEKNVRRELIDAINAFENQMLQAHIAIAIIPALVAACHHDKEVRPMNSESFIVLFLSTFNVKANDVFAFRVFGNKLYGVERFHVTIMRLIHVIIAAIVAVIDMTVVVLASGDATST